ncbi:hypothetical protein GW17_00022683 [Ensete ventricosum]|nr:hypothetical protein GW17_00022683 [Ensete ventricosum]
MDNSDKSAEAADSNDDNGESSRQQWRQRRKLQTVEAIVAKVADISSDNDGSSKGRLSCSEERASRFGIQRNGNPLRERHHEDKQAKKNA